MALAIIMAAPFAVPLLKLEIITSALPLIGLEVFTAGLPVKVSASQVPDWRSKSWARILVFGGGDGLTEELGDVDAEGLELALGE